MDEALDAARRIWLRRNQAYHEAVAVWYRSWFPRVLEANGRRYLDQVDDVKDHRPVRTVDMSYLIYPELMYPLGEWAAGTESARNQFAQASRVLRRVTGRSHGGTPGSSPDASQGVSWLIGVSGLDRAAGIGGGIA